MTTTTETAVIMDRLDRLGNPGRCEQAEAGREVSGLRAYVRDVLVELEAVQRHDGEAPSTAHLIARGQALLAAGDAQ